jgi:transcriptional regulator with XRE-family HTH domain
MRRVSRVKVLRQRLAMTQAEFAEAFHLPITTLRDWEQRRSTPDAPARALLLAIERDPEVMRRLLADRRRSGGGFVEVKVRDLVRPPPSPVQIRFPAVARMNAVNPAMLRSEELYRLGAASR